MDKTEIAEMFNAAAGITMADLLAAWAIEHGVTEENFGAEMRDAKEFLLVPEPLMIAVRNNLRDHRLQTGAYQPDKFRVELVLKQKKKRVRTKKPV